MKTNRLPDTDLANFCALPLDKKVAELQRFKTTPFVNLTYKPFKSVLSETMGLSTGLLELPRVSFSKIVSLINSASSLGQTEIDANIAVAAGLYNYCEEFQIAGRSIDLFQPLDAGPDRVTFWHNSVIKIEDRVVVPMFDPRQRASGLTPLGRRVAFSFMNERIRQGFSDYQNVSLAIFQFARAAEDDGPRKPRVHFDAGVELFTYQELDSMVDETYQIWNEICADRIEETRRRATGTDPFEGW